MSVEQWAVLALVLLLPLLQGMVRGRRARIDDQAVPVAGVGRPLAARRGAPLPNRKSTLTAAGGADTLAAPLLSLPPLPELPSDPAVLLATHRSSQRPALSAFRSSEARRPPSDETVVRWLRPTRNLRRAIIVAAILGPRPH